MAESQGRQDRERQPTGRQAPGQGLKKVEHPGQGKHRQREDYQVPVGWRLDGTDTVDREALVAWIQDLTAWAQDVRDDIVRIEGAAGFPAGDPGDPPPPPTM
jgi:hypothetical protein